MTKNIDGVFDSAAKPMDPSVQYAVAVMNGEPVVTVTGRDGQQMTYHIGKEHLAYTNE